jgi:protocatechuate 3,4-dioxygenase beta subunit
LNHRIVPLLFVVVAIAVVSLVVLSGDDSDEDGHGPARPVPVDGESVPPPVLPASEAPEATDDGDEGEEEAPPPLETGPGGEVRGIVRAPDGSPVTVPFEVTLWPSGYGEDVGSYELSVDPSPGREPGTFVFPRVSPGKYVARVSARGFLEGLSEPFEVRSLEVTTGVEVALERGGTVTGVVVDAATGEPIAGARVAVGGEDVVVYMTTGPDPGILGTIVVTTNEQGEFRIDGVAPGKHSVTAVARGHVSASIGDIEVAAGAETGGLRISLGRGGTVTGTVYGVDGKPRPGRAVVIQPVYEDFDLSGDVGLRVKTDERGVYRAEGIPPGRYRVKLPSGDDGAEIGIAFSAALLKGGEEKPKSPLGPNMVDLVEGQVATVDLRMVGRATIRVAVQTRDGEPLSEMIRLKRVEEKRGGKRRIEVPRMEFPNEKGELEVNGLEPGKWKISSADVDEVVDVASGATVEVTLVLEPSRVEGTVVDSSGRPVEGAEVSGSKIVRDKSRPFAGGTVDGVTTDQRGRFTFPRVFSGRWVFRAANGGIEGESTEVLVPRGDLVRDVRIPLEKTTDVTVRVTDPEGRPVQATVSVGSEETGESRVERTDRAGIAVIPVRGGVTYLVTAWVGGGKYEKKVDVTKGRPVKVEIVTD